MNDARSLFDGLWKFYQQNLSNEGVNHLDFAELVTYLLFLKLDHERGERGLNPERVIRRGIGWASLVGKSGTELEQQFRHILRECGKNTADPDRGIMRAIFDKAKLPVRNAAQLHALIQDQIAPHTWSGLREVLPGMYALLLDKAGDNFQKKSGQILTPTVFVSAVVEALRPTSSDLVLDPACGTGSLLVGAYSAMASEGVKIPSMSVIGVDMDERMCRLATMNLLLHTWGTFLGPAPVTVMDALAAPSTVSPTIVVCNPPFRSETPSPEGRQDFLTVTRSI
ncbi:N-6 DNA methylase, partial [Streptosporangium amethystogenes]